MVRSTDLGCVFADGYWDRWPLGESKECLAEGQVMFDCVSAQIQRNNQLSFFPGGFSQGITFCSFQLETKFWSIQHESRIEVSPSRIVAYTMFKVAALKHGSVICNLSKVLGLYRCTKFKDYSGAPSTWPGHSKSGTCVGLMLSVYSLALVSLSIHPPS